MEIVWPSLISFLIAVGSGLGFYLFKDKEKTKEPESSTEPLINTGEQISKEPDKNKGRKYKYAEVINVKYRSADGGKSDVGICTNCNEKTVVMKERFISFLPKKEIFFCDNCGVFIDGNPVTSLWWGISTTVITFFFLIVLGAKVTEHTGPYNSSPTFSYLALAFLFFGFLNGLKKIFSGSMGIYKSTDN